LSVYSIRVTVRVHRGAAVELFDSAEGLIFSFTSTDSNPEAQSPPPEPNAVEPGVKHSQIILQLKKRKLKL
jgi:hypothetical protein